MMRECSLLQKRGSGLKLNLADPVSVGTGEVLLRVGGTQSSMSAEGRSMPIGLFMN